MSVVDVDANPAILDRPAAAEAASESSRIRATAQPWRGPWVELGSIKRFEWNRYELSVAALPPALEGLRILHLTDIHLKSSWYPAMDDVLRRVQHDPPDLLFITGDFVEDKYDARAALPLVARFVDGLRSRFGVYTITGNHDGDFIAARVARRGVNVLPIGSPTHVNIRGAQVELIGLAGLTRQDAEVQDILNIPPRDLGARGPRPPRIVLSHYPDSLVRLQRLDVAPDLLFAGHTHGGQVCLPGGVPILRHDTLPRRYCHGVHRLGDSWLVVSRGMGYSSYPIRMFCPAEVVEVVLTAGRSQKPAARSQ
jgi:predicted MPP superfamily phosphohydrolase